MLVIKIASNIFLTSIYVCLHPPRFPPTRYLLRLNGCVERLETIILKCNLFQIKWERSVAFIYSSVAFIYSNSLLTYLQVTHEIPTRKKLNPRNTLKKIFQIHKLPNRKTFGPTKYPRETFLNLRNTHQKKSSTHEISTRGNFAPTKYSQVKI